MEHKNNNLIAHTTHRSAIMPQLHIYDTLLTETALVYLKIKKYFTLLLHTINRKHS